MSKGLTYNLISDKVEEVEILNYGKNEEGFKIGVEISLHFKDRDTPIMMEVEKRDIEKLKEWGWFPEEG